MKWGKQTFYCVNCGVKRYIDIIAIGCYKGCCGKECFKEFELKCASSTLGKDEQCNFIPPTPGYAGCTRDKNHAGPCAHEYTKNCDVHTEHCCEEHKVCKYGKENCSVATGKKKASFPCNCEWM